MRVGVDLLFSSTHLAGPLLDSPMASDYHRRARCNQWHGVGKVALSRIKAPEQMKLRNKLDAESIGSLAHPCPLFSLLASPNPNLNRASQPTPASNKKKITEILSASPSLTTPLPMEPRKTCAETKMVLSQT